MDITPSLLALQLITGIALGAIYALLALGLSLIFGMLTVVNFAHGAFFMVGAFIGLYFMGLTGNFWFSLVLTPLVVGAIGLVTERFLVRPLYGRGIDYPLLLTFGLSWVLIEAMRVLFGIEGLPSSTPPELRGAVDLGIGFFPKYRLFLIGATAVVVLALWLFLEKTRYGLIVRAGSRDGEICRGLGVDIARACGWWCSASAPPSPACRACWRRRRAPSTPRWACTCWPRASSSPSSAAWARCPARWWRGCWWASCSR